MIYFLIFSPSFVLCSELQPGPSTVADFISCNDLAPEMELFRRSPEGSGLAVASADLLDSLLCCEASEMLLSEADFTISKKYGNCSERFEKLSK